jgi:nickel-dependent lactate racemase
MPFGKNTMVSVNVDDDRVSGVYKLHPTPPVKNFEEMLEGMLRNPIGTWPLNELVRDKDKILIVCDDNTRRTPVSRIMPILLGTLNSAGINYEKISILFASGTHRPMSDEEKKEKLGEEVFRRIRSFDHDYRDCMVFKGNTPLGTPIYINPIAEAADFIIGIGSIIPHRYCGWSGGGKIIQPGICGEKTNACTHLLISKDESIQLGSVKNIARDEINHVAEEAGLKFIINTVLNSEGDPVALAVGHPVAAHEYGVEAAQKVCGVEMKREDIVVVSSYPEYHNLWQAGKSVYSADLAVNPGGAIVLVSPMSEGFGEHNEMLSILGKPSADILGIINSGDSEDDLSYAAAYAMNLVLDRNKVIVVSDVMGEETSVALGMTWMNSLQDAVDSVLAENPTAKINFICEGPEILPLIKGDGG